MGAEINVNYSDGTVTLVLIPYLSYVHLCAVEVEAVLNICFLADVISGMGSESWFESLYGTTEPDKAVIIQIIFISVEIHMYPLTAAWNAFDDDLVNIGCVGSGQGNQGSVTFQQSGTIDLYSRSVIMVDRLVMVLLSQM
ncbi:MAG: hypothetical protein U5J63_13840 [Fodinibius sp.]|nr:hypothetical protein [Fodinibius sp.]